jgi:hypothetical protein
MFASEHRRKFKEHLQLRDSTGGQTVSSVLAVLRFIESGRPDYVVLENVRMGEAEDGIQNVEFIIEAIADLGMTAFSATLIPTQYGLPQSSTDFGLKRFAHFRVLSFALLVTRSHMWLFKCFARLLLAVAFAVCDQRARRRTFERKASKLIHPHSACFLLSKSHENEPANQAARQPTNQPTSLPTNQPTNQPDNKRANK